MFMRSKVTNRVKGHMRSTCKIAWKCEIWLSHYTWGLLRIVWPSQVLGSRSSVNLHHLQIVMAGITSSLGTAMYFSFFFSLFLQVYHFLYLSFFIISLFLWNLVFLKLKYISLEEFYFPFPWCKSLQVKAYKYI